MIKETISNLNFLKVLDEGSHQEYYGCNQNWYTSVWQRMAGCGPTAASNLVAYLDHTRHTSDPGQNYRTKKSCLALMEEIWEYVTPTFQGVSTTKIFYEGLFSYAQSKELNTGYCFIDVPKDRPSRPGFAEVLKFLEEALSKDAPVAFLNLCNGAEKNLTAGIGLPSSRLSIRKTGIMHW